MAQETLQEADALFDARKYDAARDAYHRVASAPEVSPSDQTEAWAMIARTYLISDRKEEGRPWLERAGSSATTEQFLGYSRYLSVKGRFEWKDGRMAEAVRAFQMLYDFCHAHALHERAIDAAHMMAILVPVAEQVEWALRGIKEAEAGQVTRWLGPLWNNLGATYEELVRYPESIEAYFKAREFHLRYGSELNKLKADWAVGHAYRLAGEIEKARVWLNPVLAWCQRIGETEFLGWSWYELGQIEVARGNSKTAREHLVCAKESLEAAGIEQWDAATFAKLVDQINELADQN